MSFRFSRPACVVAVAAVLSASAQAADPAGVGADAGQSIRDLEKQPLALPGRQYIDLDLPDAPQDQAMTGGPTVAISRFTLQGNRAISSEELLALLADLQGRTLTFGELQVGANRLTRLYRERGYPLARSYLPMQQVSEGVVNILVMEGRFGAIRLTNDSRLSDDAVAAPLATLKPGDTVRADALESALLALRALPGIEAKATLQPGASVGLTDLVVNATSAPFITGGVDLDNYGNRYTGAYRLGLSLDANSPLNLGDRLSLRLLGSNEDQRYARLAWQLPLGTKGTQLGLAYSAMRYELGKSFAGLDAHGEARIASLFALQPLRRTRDLSLYAQAQLDAKALEDNIGFGAAKIHSEKQSRVATLTLNGNSRDGWGGGGVNSFALSVSPGRLDCSGACAVPESFVKVAPSLLRLQRLSDRFSLSTQLQGQWANENLDSSEKFALGGAFGVRAYPQGEASGDEGWMANLELRYALAESWQAIVFLDHGQVTLDKNPAPASTATNDRRLTGSGIGLSWMQQGWQVSTSAAWKTDGNTILSGPDRSPQFWARLSKGF